MNNGEHGRPGGYSIVGYRIVLLCYPFGRKDGTGTFATGVEYAVQAFRGDRAASLNEREPSPDAAVARVAAMVAEQEGRLREDAGTLQTPQRLAETPGPSETPEERVLRKATALRSDYDAAWEVILRRPMVGRSRDEQWAQDGTLQMNVAHLADDLTDMHARLAVAQERADTLAERLAAAEANLAEHERLKHELNAVLHPEGDGPQNPSWCDLIAFVRNDLAERDRWRAAVEQAHAKMKEASEERYSFLRECEAESERWKAEDDMYGWNFHQGMAGGANWCDLFYGRVMRAFDAALAAKVPPPPQGDTATRGGSGEGKT
jgi:hypothetical protein